MIEQDFLNKLTILYVEDDDGVRSSLEMTLKRVFKEVIAASNGEEAYTFLEEAISQNKRIDAIVSDINMPKLNGIGLLEKVREKYPILPYIFTTAYSEIEYLLDSIRLGATDYLLKPIEIKTLLHKIEMACRVRQQDELIKKQKEEFERYLSAIDNVAIISRTDLKGNITFVNTIFCEVAGYEEEELLGQPHNIVRHPDMPSSTFKELWDTIQSGQTWQGKIKNQAKDGSAYYVQATIIPLYDDFAEEISEYIAIRFLTTEDELEKREFKRKVIQNIQNSKKKHIKDAQQIQELQKQLDNCDIGLVEQSLQREKNKSYKLFCQVKHYEDELKNIRKEKEALVKVTNEKVRNSSTQLNKMRLHSEKVQSERDHFEKTLTEKMRQNRELADRVDEQSKVIRDLRDVIEHRESQLAKLSKQKN